MKNFPSWTLGLKVWLEIKQLLSIRSLCYQNQSNILEELFLFWQKTQLCISLLLVTKFIYLVKISLILILTTYTFFFFKIPFSQTFCHFLDPDKFVLYFFIQKQTTIGKNNYHHFSSTKISPFFIHSLFWQHISYLLYIPKCFAYHFYISQFLTLKTLTKLNEMLHQQFLIGKLKHIFHNL